MLGSAKRHPLVGGGAIFLTLLALLTVPRPAIGAGPPIVVESWASSVFASSARLHGKLNPNGSFTNYHFDYITKAAYDANPEGSKFTGASRVPIVSDASAGSGTSAVTVLQLLSGLKADTSYYYRLAAKNGFTTPNYTYGETYFFRTQASAGGGDGCAKKAVREQQHSSYLADCRAFEMVTPIDKNGGEAAGFGAIADGGVLQAATGGGSVTYGAEASFGTGGEGAPPASQYIAKRASGGWTAENISPPLFSGSYDTEKVGAPYQIFSGDLVRGLLLNGEHCRGEGEGCAVPNPPLAGTSAPVGYQNYYIRDSGTGSYAALFGSANSGFLTLEPKHFDLTLAGTSADLRHGVISTCAALTANASEVAAGEGCDPDKQNLYLYAPSGPLTLVNLLPAQSTGTPGAELAAQSGAVSADGSQIYWTDTATENLYLRSGGQTKLVAEAAIFQTASADGAFAFYTKEGHLHRYSTASSASTDLTPGGGVDGVLGASSAGDYVYYQDAGGLKLWHATTETVAAGVEEEGNYPPATGTARVSTDGTKLLFVSAAPELTGYDNTDIASTARCGEVGGVCDSQVYLYDADTDSLTCVSCNPTNGRPIGPSTIPGAVANGSESDSLRVYKSRSLSANGRRVFFESSDALVSTDTNGVRDTYEWEAQGEGSCNRSGGCVSLISDGRSARGASFVDASSNGSDAFFLTAGSLVGGDPGAADLYDARAGGGFLIPAKPIPCEGDACQSLPPEPVDPTLTTLLSGPGNPPVRYPKQRKRCKKGRVLRKGKCVRKRKSRRQARRRTTRGKRR